MKDVHVEVAMRCVQMEVAMCLCAKGRDGSTFSFDNLRSWRSGAVKRSQTAKKLAIAGAVSMTEGAG